MDDAGLAVAVARDAAQHGARISTYTEVFGARPTDGEAIELLARDAWEGREQRVQAYTVVNAAGAWADRVRATLLRSLKPGTPDPAPLLRPSRGVHLVFPSLTRGHGLVLFAREDDRVFFVIPFGDRSLVGTTEAEVPSPPDPVSLQPSVEEIRYLQRELRRVLPRPAEQPVLAVTSGLRPLLASTEPVGSAPREHRVVEDGPLITVVGGKFTTFRVMAMDALGVAVRRLQRVGLRLRDTAAPLPAPPPAGTAVEGLAEFAADAAFARRIEDVVRRRSLLWLSPDGGRLAAPAVAAVLARKLGWSGERTREEIEFFHARLEREDRLLRSLREDP
jgi:glycerol-3-phosphate dehydrogenase